MVFSLVFKEQLRPNRRKQRVYDTARLHGVPKMKFKRKKKTTIDDHEDNGEEENDDQ